MEACVQTRLGLGGERLAAHDAGRGQRRVVARHVRQERLLGHKPRPAPRARVAAHHLRTISRYHHHNETDYKVMRRQVKV